MCGLAGMILNDMERSREDKYALRHGMTGLLYESQSRGRHATGLAVVRNDGRVRTSKRAVSAARFILEGDYDRATHDVGRRTLLLMAHTRFATHGSPEDVRNNHPIRAGDVFGTHNGVIQNANHLFASYGFHRTGQVDSEVLFRMADESLRDGRLDMAMYGEWLQMCRGDLSAVLVARTDPRRVIVLKGNRPLSFRMSKSLGALAYASESAFLDSVLDWREGWRPLRVEPMRAVVFNIHRKRGIECRSVSPLRFRVPRRERALWRRPAEIRLPDLGAKGPDLRFARVD